MQVTDRNGAAPGVPEVRDEDMRLAHYYLSRYRSVLENMRLGYMKRFEDSGCLLANEVAKAKRCQCDINTIDGWLDRFSECSLQDGQVNHLNPDYSHKNVISFKKEDIGK